MLVQGTAAYWALLLWGIAVYWMVLVWGTVAHYVALVSRSAVVHSQWRIASG